MYVALVTERRLLQVKSRSGTRRLIKKVKVDWNPMFWHIPSHSVLLPCFEARRERRWFFVKNISLKTFSSSRQRTSESCAHLHNIKRIATLIALWGIQRKRLVSLSLSRLSCFKKSMEPAHFFDSFHGFSFFPFFSIELIKFFTVGWCTFLCKNYQNCLRVNQLEPFILTHESLHAYNLPWLTINTLVICDATFLFFIFTENDCSLHYLYFCGKTDVTTSERTKINKYNRRREVGMEQEAEVIVYRKINRNNTAMHGFFSESKHKHNKKLWM